MHGWMIASPSYSFRFLAFPSLPLHPSSRPVGQMSIGVWRRKKKSDPVLSLLSKCASTPHSLPSPLPPCLGLWCLTQTRAGDTDTHTKTQIVKDAVGAMSGCQASGTVSGAPLFILPPLPPPRPSPGPSPRPWDVRGNR